MTPQEQAKTLRMISDLNTAYQQNPEMVATFISAALQNNGIADIIKGQAGHIPMENPQANWEKLLYTPTKFKTHKIKDDQGNEKEVPLSDEEKRNEIWKTIRLRNLLGDAASGIGGTLSLLSNAQAKGVSGYAHNSASQRQKELWGPTMSDRAAAASIPLLQAIGGIESLVSGIIANRLYQSAADRKAAYLRALMGAEHNNMDTSGMYSDSWRKVQDSIANPAPGGIK